MNYQISQVGASRLNEILQRDRYVDPQRVCEILKGELEPIIANYINLSSPVNVRYRHFNEKLLFSIEIDVERIKPILSLPKKV